jgi:hypothetical protein
MATEELREALAAYAHESWSGWMKYLFSKLCYSPADAALKDVAYEPRTTHPGQRWNTCQWAGDARRPVDRWLRQLSTPYADLPEAEKESDRVVADKMLEICRRHAPLHFTGWFLGKREAVKQVLIEEKRRLKYASPSRELDVADVMDALDKAGLLQ